MSDHPFIADVRKGLDIPDDANFLEAITPKFMGVPAAERKRDLAAFDAAQRGDAGFRQESQLALVRTRLRALDARLRKVGA